MTKKRPTGASTKLRKPSPRRIKLFFLVIVIVEPEGLPQQDTSKSAEDKQCGQSHQKKPSISTTLAAKTKVHEIHHENHDHDLHKKLSTQCALDPTCKSPSLHSSFVHDWKWKKSSFCELSQITALSISCVRKGPGHTTETRYPAT